MIKYLFLIIILFFQLSCSSTSDMKSEHAAQEQEDVGNIVDPEALARVESMGNYLRALKKFEISSKTTFDIVLENDQKTEFKAMLTYKVLRPARLFAEIKSDAKHRQFFYDGKTFTIYSPKEKLYGQLAFSGPVVGLVKKLNEYGIEVPLSDLFVWGTEEAKSKNITSAIFLDSESEGNHFAIRQDKIDWQVWIPKGKTPLPEKVLYEVNDDPARPKMTATMKWSQKPDFDNSTFVFVPPKGNHKIKLKPARKPREE